MSVVYQCRAKKKEPTEGLATLQAPARGGERGKEK